MDSIKKSMEELKDLFNVQMSAFHDEVLQKSPQTPTITGLAAQFISFRTFMMSALGSLQQQVDMLARASDEQETRTRRKMLLLHGVKEAAKENTTAVVLRVVGEHLGDPELLSEDDVRQCHRMGRLSSDKPRPILLKLRDVPSRNSLWFAKTKLKGTGVTMSEFLTKPRHDTFLAARERVGVSRCWTRDGSIFVLDPEGKRHRVVTISELNAVCPLTSKAQENTNPSTASKQVTAKATASRERRVTKKPS
ncbi:uncharacterized protein LOC125489470 [Plutella xylostella]|uniref:uncharacterized protein LOC125489470 n=1 Tax=Plutella xylostella TaxID=51655 RepID=UPI002032BE11|nr:uncharacterized protein LOC125489470 [Plutella xylostella]